MLKQYLQKMKVAHKPLQAKSIITQIHNKNRHTDTNCKQKSKNTKRPLRYKIHKQNIHENNRNYVITQPKIETETETAKTQMTQ